MTRETDPIKSAQMLLRDFSIVEPPVSAKVIADNLGIPIIPVTNDFINGFLKETSAPAFEIPEFIQKLETACAWLHREQGKQSYIYIIDDMVISRKRFCAMHEIGHSILPGHERLNYFDDETICDGGAGLDRYEQEANSCASELIMPSDIFIDDALSLNTEIASIRRLADRYHVSFEAAAIKYSRNLPRYVGMVIIEPSHDDANCQYPLRIKYYAKSKKFSGYIKPGLGITENNIVHKSWISNSPIEGMIHASMIGSSENTEYHAECLPMKGNGKIMVLCWLDNDKINS